MKAMVGIVMFGKDSGTSGNLARSIPTGRTRRQDMTTKSESVNNKPLAMPAQPSAEEDGKPAAPSVDLFVVHDESIDCATLNPAVNISPDVSKISQRHPDYNCYKVLLENKVVEVVGRIARELNNPLSSVLTYVQLLLASGNLDEISREGLEIIYREAQHANAITADLLSFARRYKPEKQLISIQDVIERSLELHTSRLRDGNIEVVVKIQPDIPRTMADPHQMQQVFTNIIANAEQAMAEDHGRGRLCIKAQELGEIIRITFDDDGPGIKSNNLKSIFDPFFTTGERGIGLGLSIGYAIVENHGGCIYAMNKLEQGATIVVELPTVA